MMLGAGGLLLLPVIFLVEEHFRGNWALARWRARMTAQGEKFQVEQLIPPPPDEAENGLAALLWAGGQLAANPALREIMPSSFHFAGPGKVVYIVGQSNWQRSSYSRKHSARTATG